MHDSSGYKGVRTGFKRDTKTKEGGSKKKGDLNGLCRLKMHFSCVCVHTHTHIYIYIYIYVFACPF